jgi:hypothetical protein
MQIQVVMEGRMPITKEFTVNMEDRPGTLGKFSRVLADRGVNILAFETTSAGGSSEVRFVADDPGAAKTAMDNQSLAYTEKKVAYITLPNRPGELARAASVLGEADVNINHAYFGVDPSTSTPVLFIGVEDADRAAKVLEKGITKAAA